LFGLACHYTFRSTPIDLAPQGNWNDRDQVFVVVLQAEMFIGDECVNTGQFLGHRVCFKRIEIKLWLCPSRDVGPWK
jgi:hypothetical protein